MKKKSKSGPLIIILSGIDGAGKTTLAKRLVKELKVQKQKVRYVWYRWAAFLSYPLLAICKVLNYTKKRETITIREYYRNRGISVIWSFLYPLDYFFCSLTKLRRIRKENSIIVFDRYLPDIIADVTFQTQINLLNTIIGEILLSYLSREMFLGIVLDVSEEVALSRKEEIPSKEYVEIRRSIYLTIAKALDWEILDGTKPVEYNLRKVLEML